MFQQIKNIWFKELLDNTRDKKAMRQALIMPIFVGVLYALVIPLGTTLFAPDENEEPDITNIATIGAEYAPDELGAFLDAQYLALEPYADSPDAMRADVENGEFNTGVIFSADFSQGITAEQPVTIDVFRNESFSFSDMDMSFNQFELALQQYNNIIRTDRLQDREIDEALLTPVSLNTTYLTPPEQMANSLAGLYVPLLMAIALGSGSMLMAIDVTAGEKERGTLESLLLSPATDREIFVGKLLSVLTITFVGLMLTLLGYYLTSHLAPRFLDTEAGGISFTPILWAMVLGVVVGFAVNAVQMILAIRTKSFKDAQSILSFLMMGVMLPMMAGAFLAPDTNTPYLIPLYGIAAVISRISTGTGVEPIQLIFAVIGTLILGLVACVIALRLFNREKLLYDY